MKNLALQIREIDPIEIDQSDRAHSRGREIKRGRRTEPARADAQDARGFDPALPGCVNFRHDQMPRITREFVGAAISPGAFVDDAHAHLRLHEVPIDSDDSVVPRNASGISGKPGNARLSLREIRRRRNPFRFARLNVMTRLFFRSDWKCRSAFGFCQSV